MTIDAIWHEYKSALKGFLHSKIANEQDVEDLLQEVLIKTHANLHTLKQEKSVKAWLFQVANNTIIDFYRKKAKQVPLEPEEEEWLHEGHLAKAEITQCIVPFVQALPTEHAELLSAIDLHGMSQKAYAKAQGISYSTLKSRVQKSRALLKQKFDECCHFEQDKFGAIVGYERKGEGSRC